VPNRLRGVVAHRGAPRGWRENTVAGIAEAVRLGAAAVEVDVRTTADGVPVLFHDASLPHPVLGRAGRSWTRPVGEVGLDRLRAAVPHVPTLDEALTAVRGTGVPLVLDIGTIETARACLAALAGETAWFCGAVGALAWLRAEADVPLLLSWNRRRPPPEPMVAEVAPTMFNPSHRYLGPAMVDAWHERGIGVCTWTVDSPRRRGQLRRWGVDAIITNDLAGALRDPDCGSGTGGGS
jgi:glycerophosphoryl diester phosphodiesterase